MKGYKLNSPLQITEQESLEASNTNCSCKVKLTKSLITLPDLLRYRGDIESENVFLGSSGIGIISEAENNLFGIEKGKRVYIEPYQKCLECYNCKTENLCSNLQIAGEHFDGFLADFACAPIEKLFLLPESVSDIDALFINHTSLVLSIIDKLDVQKGNYVIVTGGSTISNILSQILIYYQAVPIYLAVDDADYKQAKDSGIYYVLDNKDNWIKEVTNITGGRMAEKVVYITDSNITTAKIFTLVSFNATLIFTGEHFNSNTVSFARAIKKQLNILCVNNGFGNTASSINLLANKAINFKNLDIPTCKYEQVPKVFEELNKNFEANGFIKETIVEII